MTNEDLLADIRNKLGPVTTLLSLIEIAEDESKDFDVQATAADRVREQLPEAKKAIDYVRNYKL